MYHVRIMQPGGTSQVHPCTHITEKHLPDGFELELGSSGKVLRLPGDGDAIFVMNDGGRTIAVHRWPDEKSQGASTRNEVEDARREDVSRRGSRSSRLPDLGWHDRNDQ